MLLAETWRREPSELFQMKNGLLFAGSAGGPDGRKGVRALLKPHIKLHEFKPLNNRLAYAHVSKNGIHMIIVVAYFPDSSYPDSSIQKMYDVLNEIRKTHKEHKYFLIGGDFNAEVCCRLDTDDPRIIGPNGMNSENTRCQWLKTWATQQQLTIINTFFSKPMENRFYIDGQATTFITDAGSIAKPDLGSDHKAVKVQAKIPLDDKHLQQLQKRQQKQQ